MARVIQVYVTDEQYAYLRWARARTGHTMARLVRHAIEETYGDEVGQVEPEFASKVLAPRFSELDRPLLEPPTLERPAVDDPPRAAPQRVRDHATHRGPDVAARRRGGRLRSLARRVRELVVQAVAACRRRLRGYDEDQPLEHRAGRHGPVGVADPVSAIDEPARARAAPSGGQLRDEAA